MVVDLLLSSVGLLMVVMIGGHAGYHDGGGHDNHGGYHDHGVNDNLEDKTTSTRPMTATPMSRNSSTTEKWSII